jgi:hypothetical protein
LPPAVSALVSKMLAKDPLRRYQAPSELVADLLQVAEQFGCGLPGVDRPNWLPALEPKSASGSLTRHLPWLVPVSLLLVSVVAAAWPIPWIDSSGDVTALLEARSQRPPVIRSAAGDGRKSAPSGEEEETEKTKNERLRSAKRVGDDDRPAPRPTNNVTAAKSASGRSTDRADSTMPPADAPAADDDSKGTVASTKGTVASKGIAASKGATDSAEPVAPATTSKVFDTEDYLEFSRSPTESAAVPSAVVPAAESIPDGLLVVGGGAKDPRRFASLADACAAAKNNDVIELRYDGPRSELPIVLHNQRIEIRAGAPWRPRVVFQPNDTNPIATDRSMLTLSGGSLKLTDVEIELDLSEAEPSENWSLFSVDQADSLRLEHCLLTVRNATPTGSTYHNKVSFFNLGSSAAGEPMVMVPKMFPAPPVELYLNNCLVRGEADLLVDRDLQPLNFSCVNALVAVSERLFVAGEGASMPQEGTRVRVTLDHVTALARQGLCRVAASDAAPDLPEVKMQLSHCQIFSDVSDAALVEHISNATAAELQSVFRWEAVDTVYHGIRTFWRIAPPGVSRDISGKTYGEWTNLWTTERNTRADPVAWRLPPPRRPLHTVTPADFRLAASQSAGQDAEGPGGASQSTGADFGLLFDLLPPPAPPEK